MRCRRAGQYAGALAPPLAPVGCLFVCLVFAGCWSPPPETPAPAVIAPETPAIPEPEEPPAPAPVESAAPDMAQPETPSPPEPEVPVGAPAEEPVPEPLARISAEQIASVQAGMSLDDVAEALGGPGQTVATDDVASAILRWTDAEGRSLVAKFENGLLVRKSIYDPEGRVSEPATPDDDENKITQSLYDAILPGMTVTEIDALLQLPGKRIAEGHEDVGIYRWVDGTGSNFTAKFEGGKLTQKTGFCVAALGKKEEPPREAAPAAPEDSEQAEQAAAQEEPAEGEGYAPEAPYAAEQAPIPAAQAEEHGEWSEFARQAQAQQPQRVRVAGAQRRAREAAQRDPAAPTGSYRPKAKLPDYRWSLRRGAYEIRIHNPSDTTVKVGLRAGDGGKNVSIPPRSTESVRVDRANYELYYVFADNPYVLHHGGGIDLDSYWMADVEVTLFNEDFDLRTIGGPLE